MPTRPTKGNPGKSNTGSKERGDQKATYGSGVSQDVAQGRAEVTDEERQDEEA